MTEEASTPKLPTNKIWWWLATWFGSGLAPKASGTVGSLAALPFAWVIQAHFVNSALLVAAVFLFFIGWWASNQYMKYYPDEHDPKQIVVDEVVGMWLLLWLATPENVGVSSNFGTFILYLIYFTLFRFFDAVKPWPISVADRKIKGGFGVMFDDILAAIYPMIIITIIYKTIMIFNPDINLDCWAKYISVIHSNVVCDVYYIIAI